MKDSRSNSEHQDRYTAGYDTEVVQALKQRTVVKEAGFFIPYINKGIDLLDCGCGPGTITVGLAGIIAPGKAVGIDIAPGQIEIAKNYAREQGVDNVRFEKSSAYELPFADNTFDAVFAHALLQHLHDPLKTLAELKRVLKPGGVIGVRDADHGGMIISPYSPQLERANMLLQQFMRHNGGNPCVGRQYRELLRKAGFTRIVASATCEFHNNLEDTRKRGYLSSKLIEHMADTAVNLGWADRDEIGRLSASVKEWGENQDAFGVHVWCEAIGYKDDIQKTA